jgi:asparagine synthase (glutamine-hydrolysing)
MPGIVGFVTRMGRAAAEPQLRRMVEAIRHEPFYKTGMWIDESLGVYVGWAAREGSFAEHMPLVNERGDIVLIFAGEDFPDPGTRRVLEQKGHLIDGVGPAYLVHLYEEDPGFPAGLNGRFHGLVADTQRGTALLFNDRYGMQRIYYHQARDGFYFAAEAKAILAVRPELRSIDPRALGEFITCGCVLENRTLFEGVHVLPPGAAWVLHGGSVEQKRAYFDPAEWEGQAPLGAAAYAREIEETFSRILPRYFEGGERIGVSLTGGLDTRMIMAWRKDAPGSLPCYSFAGVYRDSQDVLVARRVAAISGQPHQDIRVGKEFWSRFPKYAERTVYLTDGCADVGCSAVLYANERARAIAPVRMTGNYGGEVLRRVRAFKPVDPLPDLFDPELLPYVRQARSTYDSMSRVHPLTFAAFKQTPWHHYGLFALEQSQLSVRSPFLDNDFVKLVFRAPESACASNDICLRLIASGNAAMRRMRTDRGEAGADGTLIGSAMRHFLQFTFKAEYAYDHGMPQWLAQIDHLFSSFHLERLFLGRHKYYHFRVWYRDAVSKYVQDVLLDSRTLSRPFFEKNRIEAIVEGHLKGYRNYTTAIHQALTLELLHRSMLDSR